MQLRAQCPSCRAMLEINNGQVVNFTRAQTQNPFSNSTYIDPNIAARRKKSRKILLISLGAIVGLIVIYATIGRQYFSYKNAVGNEETWGIYDCDAYLYKYPSGIWVEEVKSHKDDLSFKKAKASSMEEACAPCYCKAYQDYYLKEFPNGKHAAEVKKAMEECDYKVASKTRNIPKVTAFLENYPGSAHAAEMKKLREELWDGVIAHYEENVAKYAQSNPKGVEFFRTVLKYIKENVQSTIYISFKKTLDLRDWKDFPKESRDVLDGLVDNYNSLPESDRDISGNIPRPTDEPPPSLKSYFTSGNVETMELEVAAAVEKSFADLFNDTIIYVKRMDPDSQAKGNPIVIVMDYSIANKVGDMDGVQVPSLYQKTSQAEYSIKKTFDGHILGIGIDFKFDMSIPGSTQNFGFKDSAEPADEISDINSISDAYEKMTYSAFGDFLRKINLNLGLASHEDTPQYE